MLKLHHFHGGLRLDGHKAESLNRGLQQASLPERLFLPLRQHIGDPNKPVVKVGDRVLQGQTIAAASSLICAAVHAPTSGKISAIESHPIAHPSGQADTCIVIDVDGEDQALDPAINDPESLAPEALIEQICRAGIVGLGGAAFPTTPKLLRGKAQGIEILIINGAECEPYITCDDILMRHRAAEIVRGSGYLQQILSPQTTYIGIEDNKPEAIAAMRQALAQHPLPDTEIVSIPTIYPSGGEKQLVQILTGQEVPHGQLAFDIGLLCQNVGTCVAITQFLEQGRPLISRIVTITGDNISQPGNWEVRLGTPISHLIGLAGGYRDSASRHLVMGGSMMGFSLSGGEVPIVKASNCIMVMREETIPKSPGHHDECIRCGKCTEVCPAQLLPQQLYWHARAKAYDRTQEFHLFDCIECGCCSTVCPSRIPLVQYYRAAKSEIRAARKMQIKSDHARRRFEFREKRLLLKKQQDEERRRLKREALEKRKAQSGETTGSADPVQAALDRVKARKKAVQEDSQ
ncbi:MAG: electron transport complex subunit RsxC [Gammaproteobacteria bacterium]|nr:electron transport complex subunit RsxC [Gammaproteobacteria bacterium]MDH3858083.1 electron transport complex subunit RsxC [Gammaproteobacteria bacterium]